MLRHDIPVYYTNAISSLMAKIMSPLSGMMMKSARKAMEADMEDVAALAEAAR